MDILTEHREGEITVFTNNSTPEVHLTTRRAEAKASVNENAEPIVVVAENIGSVKEIAQRTEILDEVMASLPTIMQVVPVAEIVAKAKDEAVEAKESAEESAQQAEEAVLRAEEVSSEQAEIAKGYAEEAKTQAEKLASAFKIVGTVPTVADLPKNAEVGHIYLVGNESVTNKPEYVWTASGKWEKFGETVELPTKVSEFENDAGYATETELNNALDTKQDKFTVGEGLKLEGNVLSATSTVPEGVYSEENLIGGKDIEIVKKSGGIDENTVACWHFDTVNDEVSGLPAGPFAGENNLLSDYVKFGEKSFNGGFTNTSLSFNSNESFSFDFWAHLGIPGSSSYVSTGYCGLAGNTNIFYVYGIAGNKMDVFLHGTTTTTEFVTPRGEWFHVYGGYDHETKTYSVFANGNRIFSQVNNTSFTSSFFSISYKGSGVRRFDEVRVSKCVRWTEDFTPPEVPYEAGSAGSVINFTGQNGKNIGEVYYSQSSLASDNAGALPLFTGETITSANTIYPDFYSWVESHTELQTTAEEYETALNTYGECPKYVVSNGSLRLPKLANYIKMANTAEGITQSEAGLPNITGSYQNTSLTLGTSQTTGALYQLEESVQYNSRGDSGSNQGIGFDASLSSEVYGKSDTVTPAHTTLYPWVCAYNATVPTSTAQAAEFQEGLSGKADLDLSNSTPSANFKKNSIGWLMPDYSASVTVTMPYTANSNGWFVASAANSTSQVKINGVKVAMISWDSGRWSGNLNCQILVSEGDVITGAVGDMFFIPCKGEAL